MHIERTKNTKRNIMFGLLNQCVAVVLPFFVRTVMINKLGVEYLGLNSLFGSMLYVLNLAELGFGNAIVYHMYKPIAENDTYTICALLRLYKKIYRIIGVFILIVGIILLPFLSCFIKDGYPKDVNIYLLFIIYLSNTVLSYWLFAYKTSLLNAFHRTDIISKIGTVTKIILYVLQIVVLHILTDYYVFLMIMPLCTVINNILSAVVIHKLFPQYQCKGKIDKKIFREIIENTKGLTLYKVCQTSRNTLDSIFISAFLGLRITAIYTNYFYLISSVTAFIAVISNSMLAGVGNSIVTEPIEKNYHDMQKFDFLYMWIGGWCTICLLCLMQPFMELWVGKKMMLDIGVVILLCVYFYILKMGEIKAIYSDAIGLWWENRYRTVIETVLNLGLNYLLVRIWGIYGIIIATIISLLLLGFGTGAYILFKCYFKNGRLIKYFLFHFKFAVITCIIAGVTFFMCGFIHFEGILGFILKTVICCLLPNFMYYCMLSRTVEFKVIVPWVLRNINFH